MKWSCNQQVRIARAGTLVTYCLSLFSGGGAIAQGVTGSWDGCIQLSILSLLFLWLSNRYNKEYVKRRGVDPITPAQGSDKE